MFGSKSPASLLSHLFDKREKEEEAGGDEHPGRKRSQSMFAPSMAALISGDQVGTRGIFENVSLSILKQKVFCCEGAAKQVHLSLCLSVCLKPEIFSKPISFKKGFT